MNLTQFIKGVDAAVKVLSRESLAGFIHNLARTLPEKDRVDFLKELEELRGSALGAAGEHKEAISEIENIQQRLSSALDDLASIEDGELYVVGNLNYEYDEWQDDEEDEFIFEDPENVSDVIANICELIHQCIDVELYEEGARLAQRLIDLRVMVEGEYTDYNEDTLSFEEFTEIGLGSFDYRRFILDTLSAVYWSNSMEERPDALFYVFDNAKGRDITLETFIQSANKEPDYLPEFLKLWIEYLGNCKGALAKRLLSEAVTLQNDSVLALAAARKYSQLHPELYVQLLKKNLCDERAPELFNIGEEALLAIHPQICHPQQCGAADRQLSM